MSTNFSLISLMAFLLVNCGAEEKKKATAPLKLQGTWGYECIQLTENSITERQTKTVEFKETSFEETLLVYDASDDDCNTEIERRKIEGSYTEGTKSGNQTPITLKLTSVNITISNATTVAIYNGDPTAGGTEKVCGGNWIINEEKKLTEDMCKEYSRNLPHQGMTIYDIYTIKSTELLFGSKESGIPTTTDMRPTAIEESVVLKPREIDETVALGSL